MEDCIFCKIIAGEIPSNKIYEDEDVYAFLDIAPVNKGHTLVIPKKHAKNIYDVSEEDLCKVTAVVKKLSIAIKKAVNADGISIGQSNEKAAGQAVFHIHFHIIPRFTDDGLKLWPQGRYEEGEAAGIVDKIKQNL